MDVQELVRRVAEEVLRQLEGGRAKTAVRVLAPRESGLEARVRERLGEDIAVSFSGEEMAGEAARHILPFLSCACMADLATGRACGETASEVLGLLLRGKTVEVLAFEYRDFADTAPDALYALYAAQEKTLAAFGLKACEEKRPDTLRLKKNLVTEKDVREAVDRGIPALSIPSGARVTPLAAQCARDLNVRMEKR